MNYTVIVTKSKIIILFLFHLLMPAGISAQNRYLSHHIGINVGGGSSHLFWGNPFAQSDLYAAPRCGGATKLGVEYELKYSLLLIQTGFGVAFSVNNNSFQVDGFSMDIQEYPMQYHYECANYIERDTYGYGYVPFMVGVDLGKCYLLVGSKLGVFSFANSSQVKTNLSISATDEDIIDPLFGLPTHGLQNHYVESEARKIAYSPFNAMLSAEVGIKLEEIRIKRNKKTILYESAESKSFSDRLSYRLSAFVDYGLSNLHAYSANPVPLNGQTSGGLIVMNSATDVNFYPMSGYEPYKNVPINNMLIGIKLSIQYQIPHGKDCRCED